MNKKIVVTGINAITSLGLDLNETWSNLLKGKSGVKNITLFDTSESDTKIAAQLPDNFDEYSSGFVKKRISKQMTRATKMGLVCAKETINQYNLDFSKLDKSRCGVVMGVVSTGNKSNGTDANYRNSIVKNMNNAMSAWIALEYKLEGPNYTIATACSSSAHAIGSAYDMIQNNRADLVIVGGADSTINKEEIKGFNAIFALSTANENPEKACKPFSKNRDGFVVGEGAGIMILESEEHAKARNAEILAEIADYALTCESYNIMAPQKDGEGMAKTINLALKNADIEPEKIDYINAHGTSTTLNDMYETMAIKKVFGEHSRELAISSTKSMIGHTIGAAGVIEAIITIKTINSGIITPTINYEKPDPDLDLDYIPNKPRESEVNYAVSNSFAFGGHNSSIVIKKYDI